MVFLYDFLIAVFSRFMQLQYTAPRFMKKSKTMFLFIALIKGLILETELGLNHPTIIAALSTSHKVIFPNHPSIQQDYYPHNLKHCV